MVTETQEERLQRFREMAARGGRWPRFPPHRTVDPAIDCDDELRRAEVRDQRGVTRGAEGLRYQVGWFCPRHDALYPLPPVQE